MDGGQVDEPLTARWRTLMVLIVVLVRMKLYDRRVEQTGKGRDVRMLEGASCHDNMLGFEVVAGQAHDVAIIFQAKRVYPGAQPDGQLEAGGACLQIVGYRILG